MNWLVRRGHWLFPRAIGLVYLAAFASLYPQIPGLIGNNGIAPFGIFFRAVHERYGLRAYYLLPSLAWLHPTGKFLSVLVALGVLLSLTAVAKASSYLFAGLWVLWLSVVSAGGDFLSFQWDVLLLEAGFLTIFYALPTPPRAIVWLVRWLLFRLMFLSGSVKLLSKDETWRNWTALDYHYQTQPIPNAIAWYMHHAPHWFQLASLAFMWTAELAIPFLIFTPRRIRHAAGLALILFQVILIVTGNYAFFNLLTIALCLPLFEKRREERQTASAPRWRENTAIALAVFIVPVSLLEMADRFGFDVGGSIIQTVSPFHVVNSYGLFAVMTTTRPEIVIEGTDDDGATWREYEFPYKPGALNRHLPFVAPHQPRLDWQMWFAALGGAYNNRWFGQMMVRVLNEQPEVMRLLGKSPFPGHRPQAVRAKLYEYRFTTAEEKARTGNWWARELKGMYFPEVVLPQGVR